MERGPAIPHDVILPQVDPPEGRVGRFTNQLNFIRYNVFQALSKAKDFRKPVDLLFARDYYSYVKKPMDMGTIRQRILNKFYSSSRECLRDFQQMFANAYHYNINEPYLNPFQNARRAELLLIRELLDMPTEEVEIESLGRHHLPAPAPQQDAEVTPVRHSLRLQMKREGTSAGMSAGSEAIREPSASPRPSPDSSGDSSDGDGEEDEEDSEERMIPLKQFQKWERTQVAFWKKHMEIIKKQMDHLNSLDLSLAHYERTKAKKRKVEAAPANFSSSEIGKRRKTTPPKPDISKPMTQEETEELEQDIHSLCCEDFEEVIDDMNPYITQADLDESAGGLPLGKLPPHCQWEMREMTDEKLKTTVRYAVDTPPQE